MVLRHSHLEGLNITLISQRGRCEVSGGFQQHIINERRIVITASLLFSLKGIIISFFIVLVLRSYASFPLWVVVVAALSFVFIRHGLKPVFCTYHQYSLSLSLHGL